MKSCSIGFGIPFINEPNFETVSILTMDVSFIDADVNPDNILLNFTIPGYQNGFSVPMVVINELQKSQMKYAIVYGCGVGASSILLFVVWILCSRKTPLFIMNNITLVLYVISSSLNLAYITGPLLSVSVFLTGILTSHDAINVVYASNALQMLLIFLIQLTMAYHVYVMFKSPEIKYLRYMLVGFLGCLQIVTTCLYINYNVLYSRRMHKLYETGQTYQDGTVMTFVPFILFQCSVNFSSIFLVLKLIMAIRTRRYLGLRQFGGFHILMIVSLQTMLVPSILVLVNYAAHKAVPLNLLSSVSMMIIVLSLPASSMWAAAANASSAPSSAASSLFRYTTSDSDRTLETKSDHFIMKHESHNLSPNSLPLTLVQKRISDATLELPKELEDLIDSTSI